MKRLFSLILALVLILAMSPAVRADLIYIPDNSFLEDHMSDCTQICRHYTTITEAQLYNSPEDDHVVLTYAAGEKLRISYIYIDARDIVWGYTESGETQHSGWVAMAYLELVYDFLVFKEVYADRIDYSVYSDPLDHSLAGQEIRFWDYPGSANSELCQLSADPNGLPCIDSAFTDDAGRKWGFVLYYDHNDRMNFWICLDDPTADLSVLFPNGAPVLEVTNYEPQHPEQAVTPTTNPVPMLIGGGVAICITVTAVMLLKKKKEARK